jgi:hypothetical protein
MMSEEIAIHVWVVAAWLPAAPKLSEGGCEARDGYKLSVERWTFSLTLA